MTSESSLYGGIVNRRITVRDLQAAKDRGERWAMLTSYDMLTAALFDDIGVKRATIEQQKLPYYPPPPTK